MSISQAAVKDLIIKHLKEGLSKEERQQLEMFMQASPGNRELVGSLLNRENVKNGLEQLYGSREAVWKQLQATVKKPGRRILSIVWSRRVAAAFLLLLTSTSMYLLLRRHDGKGNMQPTAKFADIAAPSQTKAYLTLANGQRILLDSLDAGNVTAAGLSLQVTAKGLSYKQPPSTTGTDTRNTLTVPAGSKPVKLILPDGTEVWVNVASSITYNTVFAGKERTVEMTGEAYFNVAHHSRQPFIVRGKHVNVKVYGTVFNINAYDDEQEITTTLLSGSIKIEQPNSGASGMLKPGQQALLGQTGVLRIHDHVNVEAPVSWVKGKFQFENDDLPAILRQLSRWYDVKVVYEGKVAGRTFSADISRDKSLVTILRIIEASGVHVTLEGKTITVKP